MQERSGSPHTSASYAPEVPEQLRWAISKLGVLEAPGAADHPDIVQFHAATRGGPAPDSVAWCSSFVNWCWKQCGIDGTRTKRARDWIERPPKGFVAIYQTLEGVEIGDVVVKSRGADPNLGHVYFFFGYGAMRGHLGLGGNQQNAVGVERYMNHHVVGYLRHVG